MKAAAASLLAVSALGLSCAPRNRAVTVVPAAAPRTAFERQIQNAIDAGEGDYLLRSLRQRVVAEPDNLQLRLELAKAYSDRGSNELALEHYRLAAGRFPDSGEAHLLLARTLREFGQRAEAARTLEGFLNTHPQKSPQYFAWLGILRDELKQWPEGEKAHRTALALAPGADYLHNNLGYSLLMQGKKGEAAEEFRAALRLNPNSAVARNNLGLALVNQPEQAVSHWRSVSDPASAHNNLGAVLIEQGRYADARKELDLALGYNRTHLAALDNLRLVSRLDGKPAFFTVKPVETRWTRWKSAMRRFFAGSEPSRVPGAATAASGSAE